MKKISNFFVTHSLHILISICLFLLFLSISAPYIFTRYSGIADFSETGGIGDTISGTMSPFINIIGVLLTFSAFYVQYVFNKKQRDEIIEQTKKSEKQYTEQQIQLNEQSLLNKASSFERTLFNLLDVHIKNLNSLDVEKIGTTLKKNGNQVIAFINNIVDDFYTELVKKNIADHDAIVIAYLFVYYGSSLYTNKALKKRYEHIYSPALPIMMMWDLSSVSHYDVKENGYSGYLSNYFRLLFQIYNYIDNADYLDKTLNNRYFYSKIVRSSLSIDEQLLIYYNILSPMGIAWREKKFIFKYKIIKNIQIGSIRTYSPVKWLRTFSNEDIDQDFITDFFEFYSDEN